MVYSKLLDYNIGDKFAPSRTPRVCGYWRMNFAYHDEIPNKPGGSTSTAGVTQYLTQYFENTRHTLQVMVPYLRRTGNLKCNYRK